MQWHQAPEGPVSLLSLTCITMRACLELVLSTLQQRDVVVLSCDRTASTC